MSGMRLIGGEMPEIAKTTEQIYDNLSYLYKEWVGFPARYIDLTNDQKFFIDNMYEGCYNQIMINPEVREEVDNFHELVVELENSMKNIKDLLR